MGESRHAQAVADEAPGGEARDGHIFCTGVDVRRCRVVEILDSQLRGRLVLFGDAVNDIHGILVTPNACRKQSETMDGLLTMKSGTH